jgi:hypothetical protein
MGEKSEWYPIETAPIWTHVMLWFPKGEHVIALIGPRPDRYETVGYMGDDKPTHWRSLPPRPSDD